MSDYDGNFMDMDPLSSLNISEILEMLDSNNNGLNPISETFPQTNVSTDPQSEQRSGGILGRLAVRRGLNVPPLEIESLSSFANSFRNPSLVPSLILEISPGFSSLTPFLQSPNVASNSSSQVIPLYPIPNYGPPETVVTSGGAHATMMISNNNIPHQPMDVDLPLQGGSDDIPTEETSVYITSHESNADPVGAPLVPSIDSDVVAEMNVMNLISFESGSDDKDKEYNQEEDKDEDNNIVVETSSRKRRKIVISNIMGVTRQNKTKNIIIQVESEEDHPDDGFRWRKYGKQIVKGSENPRTYHRCSYTGCKVKKHVQRSTDNVKLVMATYDGIHEHEPPPERKSKSGTKNKSGSSKSQDPSNQSLGLGVLPSSFSVNKNRGVMNQEDEPNVDCGVILDVDGTLVFQGIRERLSRNLGINL